VLKHERATKRLKCDECSQAIYAKALAFSCEPCDHDMCLACGDLNSASRKQGRSEEDEDEASPMPLPALLPSPMPLPALNISPELREHVEKMVKKKPRHKQGLNGRKDFVLDKVLVWRQVKQQVRHSYLSPLPPCPCLQ
jgi:hypothetical protein